MSSKPQQHLALLLPRTSLSSISRKCSHSIVHTCELDACGVWTRRPLIRVMPTPHPATTCVIKLSGSLIGATGAAYTEVVTTKASAAKAINLIIRASHVFKKEIFLTRG